MPPVAGGSDPRIVPLPVSAAYTILVELGHYWCPDWPPDRKIKRSRGTYSLQAHSAGKRGSKEEANLDLIGSAMWPYWTGTVSSKEQQFDGSTEHYLMVQPNINKQFINMGPFRRRIRARVSEARKLCAYYDLLNGTRPTGNHARENARVGSESMPPNHRI